VDWYSCYKQGDAGRIEAGKATAWYYWGGISSVAPTSNHLLQFKQRNKGWTVKAINKCTNLGMASYNQCYKSLFKCMNVFILRFDFFRLAFF
jgi:hypothetical protein